MRKIFRLALVMLLISGSVMAKGAVSVEKIIANATAFINSLNADQKAAVVLEYTKFNAGKWTNLPCGLECRQGILFSSLNDAQLTLAKAVVKEAMGKLANRGSDQAMQILAADGVLGAKRQGYSAGNYIIAFLGKPGMTGKWQLQLGGHHLAVNLTFNDGKIAGASPLFMGLEPKSWEADGKAYAPLKDNHGHLVGLLASLNAEQLSAARLEKGYDDVSVGPGKDGQFPSQKSGVKIGTLSRKQKTMVLEAIKTWVDIADETSAKLLMAAYAKDIDNTYIAYYGDIKLANVKDYIRIDGPGVWVEFACQPGVIWPKEIHYHTIYRDRMRDYGGNF
jgi:hypothetical protein